MRRPERASPTWSSTASPCPAMLRRWTGCLPGVPVDRRFAGTWVGAWGGDLKTILTFESIEADGTATVIYAVGDHALWGIKRGWWRFSGRIEGKKLRIKGRITEITYELAPSGRLLATYARRNQRSRAVLTRQNLAALRKPGATVPWIGGNRSLSPDGPDRKRQADPARSGRVPAGRHGPLPARRRQSRLDRPRQRSAAVPADLYCAHAGGIPDLHAAGWWPFPSGAAGAGPTACTTKASTCRPGAGLHLRDEAHAGRRGPGARGCRCGHCSAAKEA